VDRADPSSDCQRRRQRVERAVAREQDQVAATAAAE
jgi:hypothetical protein